MKPKVEFFEKKFETLNKGKLLELQFEEFKKEIKKAWRKNAFYRKKFVEAGITPNDIKTRDDITKVPVTTKEELIADIAQNPPYGSRLQIPRDKIVMVVETSGTSGRGQEIHPLSMADTKRIYNAEAYGFYWAGARPGTVVMLTFPIGLTSAPLWWHGAMALLKANYFNIGRYSTSEKLKYIQRFGAEVLHCSSAYLRTLEHEADQLGIDLRAIGINSILMSGGGLSPKWIERVEEKWGAKLYEQYGCTGKAITWTCEYGMQPAGVNGRRGLIHWLPHHCLVEVNDPTTGKQVKSGVEGKIIITPLGYQAAPLIRFSTDDKGVFLSSENCPCGRPFDGFECNSIGRYDDMIKVKGINVWQSALDKVVCSYRSVWEYTGEVIINEQGREEAVVYIQFCEFVQKVEKKIIIDNLKNDLRGNTGIKFRVQEWSRPPLFDASRPDKKMRRWKDRRGEIPGGSL